MPDIIDEEKLEGYGSFYFSLYRKTGFMILLTCPFRWTWNYLFSLSKVNTGNPEHRRKMWKNEIARRLNIKQRAANASIFYHDSTIPWWMPYPNKTFTIASKEWKVKHIDYPDDEKREYTPSVEILFHINRHSGFHFTVSVNGQSFNERNPFKAAFKHFIRSAEKECRADMIRNR